MRTVLFAALVTLGAAEGLTVRRGSERAMGVPRPQARRSRPVAPLGGLVESDAAAAVLRFSVANHSIESG